MRSDFRFTRFVTVVRKLVASCVIVAVYLVSPRGAFPFLRHLFRLTFLVLCFLLAVSTFPCQVLLSSCPAFVRHSFSCPCGLLFQVGFASACALASPVLPRIALAGSPPLIGFRFPLLPVFHFAFSSGRVWFRFALPPFLSGLHDNMPFIFTC